MIGDAYVMLLCVLRLARMLYAKRRYQLCFSSQTGCGRKQRKILMGVGWIFRLLITQSQTNASASFL
jgi:hypothetical protein